MATKEQTSGPHQPDSKAPEAKKEAEGAVSTEKDKDVAKAALPTETSLDAKAKATGEPPAEKEKAGEKAAAQAQPPAQTSPEAKPQAKGDPSAEKKEEAGDKVAAKAQAPAETLPAANPKTTSTEKGKADEKVTPQAKSEPAAEKGKAEEKVTTPAKSDPAAEKGKADETVTPPAKSEPAAEKGKAEEKVTPQAKSEPTTEKGKADEKVTPQAKSEPAAEKGKAEEKVTPPAKSEPAAEKGKADEKVTPPAKSEPAAEKGKADEKVTTPAKSEPAAEKGKAEEKVTPPAKSEPAAEKGKADEKVTPQAKSEPAAEKGKADEKVKPQAKSDPAAEKGKAEAKPPAKGAQPAGEEKAGAKAATKKAPGITESDLAEFGIAGQRFEDLDVSMKDIKGLGVKVGDLKSLSTSKVGGPAWSKVRKVFVSLMVVHRIQSALKAKKAGKTAPEAKAKAKPADKVQESPNAEKDKAKDPSPGSASPKPAAKPKPTKKLPPVVVDVKKKPKVEEPPPMTAAELQQLRWKKVQDFGRAINCANRLYVDAVEHEKKRHDPSRNNTAAKKANVGVKGNLNQQAIESSDRLYRQGLDNQKERRHPARNGLKPRRERAASPDSALNKEALESAKRLHGLAEKATQRREELAERVKAEQEAKRALNAKWKLVSPGSEKVLRESNNYRDLLERSAEHAEQKHQRLLKEKEEQTMRDEELRNRFNVTNIAEECPAHLESLWAEHAKVLEKRENMMKEAVQQEVDEQKKAQEDLRQRLAEQGKSRHATSDWYEYQMKLWYAHRKRMEAARVEKEQAELDEISEIHAKAASRGWNMRRGSELERFFREKMACLPPHRRQTQFAHQEERRKTRAMSEPPMREGRRRAASIFFELLDPEDSQPLSPSRTFSPQGASRRAVSADGAENIAASRGGVLAFDDFAAAFGLEESSRSFSPGRSKDTNPRASFRGGRGDEISSSVSTATSPCPAASRRGRSEGEDGSARPRSPRGSPARTASPGRRNHRETHAHADGHGHSSRGQNRPSVTVLYAQGSPQANIFKVAFAPMSFAPFSEETSAPPEELTPRRRVGMAERVSVVH